MLLLYLLYAFLGGVIMNFMPCVLPVISVKLLALVEKSRSSSVKEGLKYTAGVMLTFLVLSLILMAFSDVLGWGFQMQYPPFLLCFTYLTFLLGMNLSGAFELPYFLSGSSGFSGVLSTLLATPCTAPFMATAIGFAVTQSPIVNIMIFQLVALGLASPYLAIAAFPGLLHFFPKPGAWMVTFRKLVAIPMYITAAWLLWVLVRVAGDHVIFPVACGLVGIFSLISFWGVLAHYRKSRALIASVAVVLCLVLPIYSLKQYEDAEDIKVSEFSYEKLQHHLALGNPVLVAVTADWCIPCKANERIIMHSNKIKKLIQDRSIAYMKADWTKADVCVTKYMHGYHRSGVPLYVLYDGAEEHYTVLSQVFTEDYFVREIYSFLEFGESRESNAPKGSLCAYVQCVGGTGSKTGSSAC